MLHKHSVYDTDLHFIIDPITRKMVSESGKITLVQNDHNSERFTFQIPRYVEGHDMSLCDQVEIHYINTDSTNKKNQSMDVYPVDDLQLSPNSDDVVICSWLISQNATMYAGTLNFIVRYACINTDGTIDYQWFTEIHSGITVVKSIFNTDFITQEADPDVLAVWKKEIMESVMPYLQAVDEAKEAARDAKKSEDNAKASEMNAKASETAAAISAAQAKLSENNAKLSETNAKISEVNAKLSEENAKTSETNAANSAAEAKESAKNAADSAKDAKEYEICAAGSAKTATEAATAAATSASAAASVVANVVQSEYNAKLSEMNSKFSEENAKLSELISKSYAVGNSGIRSGENTDNSKYYSEVAGNLVNEAKSALDQAEDTLLQVNQKITDTVFTVNFETGELEYTSPNFIFTINTDTGNLEWEVA